jgi:hypothetical protein
MGKNAECRMQNAEPREGHIPATWREPDIGMSGHNSDRRLSWPDGLVR